MFTYIALLSLLATGFSQTCTETGSFTLTTDRQGASGCYNFIGYIEAVGSQYPYYSSRDQGPGGESALIIAGQSILFDYSGTIDYTQYAQYYVAYTNTGGENVFCDSTSIFLNPTWIDTIEDVNDKGFRNCVEGGVATPVDDGDLVITCGCEETVSPTPEPVSPTPEPVSPTPEPVSPTPEPVSPTPESVAPTPEPVSPTPEPTPSNTIAPTVDSVESVESTSSPTSVESVVYTSSPTSVESVESTSSLDNDSGENFDDVTSSSSGISTGIGMFLGFIGCMVGYSIQMMD